MANTRLVRRSLRVGIALLMAIAISTVAEAQEPQTVQKLIERGSLTEAVAQAESERGNPESTYLAAQALAKLDNPNGAQSEYRRLSDAGVEPDWKAIGESGAAMIAGDLALAMSAAARAVSVNDTNPYAHYQVGVIASRQHDFGRALASFERAAELKSDFAYAHYYAGLASQRLRQTAKMSQHLEMFMRIAPDAPERTAVSAILRTMRPRR